MRIGREYGEELSERRKILRYLELKDSLVFEQDAILQASGRKLKEIQIARRELEQGGRAVPEGIRTPDPGKVLELPKEFEAMLRGWKSHAFTVWNGCGKTAEAQRKTRNW